MATSDSECSASATAVPNSTGILVRTMAKTSLISTKIGRKGAFYLSCCRRRRRERRPEMRLCLDDLPVDVPNSQLAASYGG